MMNSGGGSSIAHFEGDDGRQPEGATRPQLIGLGLVGREVAEIYCKIY